MFTLVTESCKFFRVKRGQTAEEIENALNTPVTGECFQGRIIEVKKGLKRYCAKPGDSYKTLAKYAGVDEEELENLNGGRIIYPTCKLFLPCK